MRELNLDDIKKILKIEIEKQIMWAQHVDLGTNKYDMLKQKQGLKQVTEQEESLLKKLAQEEKEYNQKLDSKIAVWLQNLEISVNEKSVEYKSLKRHLTDLSLDCFFDSFPFINHFNSTKSISSLQVFVV